VADYRIVRQWPGKANADDVRSSVTIETPELPFPLRFYFLRWHDTETKELGYEYLGYAFEPGPVSVASLEGVDLDAFGPTRDQARWVKDHINTYRRIAEHAILYPADDEGVWQIYRVLRTKALLNRAQGKRWADEELTLVVRSYAAGKRLGLTDAEIATELGCDRSTLHRARKKARERGLDGPDLDPMTN
jgi:hypothetical protein